MAIERLLGDVRKSKFLDDDYLKLSFSLAQGAQRFAHWGGWEMVETRPNAIPTYSSSGKGSGGTVPQFLRLTK